MATRSSPRRWAARSSGSPAAGPSGRTTTISAAETLTLNAWHRDQVTRKPEAAKVLACNEFCENAALVYGDRAFTVQAHPEYGDDFIDGLIRTRGKGVVPDDLMAAASARFGQGNSSATIADRIAAFFKTPGPEIYRP